LNRISAHSSLYDLRGICANISYSRAEIGLLLDVSPGTIWNWTKQGFDKRAAFQPRASTTSDLIGVAPTAEV